MNRLKDHLKEENPLLVDVVESFSELDRITRKIGFFDREESYTASIPWWPVISVLGTYSSGKSAFINHYLKYSLQATGSQAVDDKFTVICFTREDTVRILPGLALDADPRFPFYKISQAIEEAAPGEGRRIDAYLQLKTCPSEKLRGKILIDSPGFDADAQRTSILRITDHIIDLSDLVLVFFDARHPESGSMNDTLKHLVKGTIHRRDSSKFLFILNQIDATAQEDNPEEVFAAWQRALAQHGLTAGRCYTIYNPECAIPIANESIRARFENKRDADLIDIYNRIEDVKVERAYRIVGIMEQTAHLLEKETIPRIQRYKESWRRWVLGLDSAIFGVIFIALFAVTVWRGYWEHMSLKIPFWDRLIGNARLQIIVLGALFVIAVSIHFSIRQWAANRMPRKVTKEIKNPDQRSSYERAFRKNTRWWRSVFSRQPSGSGKNTMKCLAKVLDETNLHIQRLNDEYTNPSGEDIAVSKKESSTL
jgi:hypothetical protein